MFKSLVLKSRRPQRVGPRGENQGMLLASFLATLVVCSFPGQSFSQAPYVPQAPFPSGGQPSEAMPNAQQSLEYAFRPDLSNPEYGECLQLEKQWKALWANYTQYYNQARMMYPGNPQYAQITYYLQNLKPQLDAAWNAFSGKCVYFPKR